MLLDVNTLVGFCQFSDLPSFLWPVTLFARTAMGQLAYPKRAAMGRLHFIQSVVVYRTGEPL